MPPLPLRLLGLAGVLALAACSLESDDSSPAAEAAITASTSAILRGDSRRALDALQAVPADGYAREDAVYRTCMIGRFDRDTPPPLAVDTDDAFVKDLLHAYQDYWWHALATPTDRETLEADLQVRVRALLGPAGEGTDDWNTLDARVFEALRRRGLHGLLGRTPPLRDLMLWRSQTTRTEDVALPDGHHRVDVDYLDDFLSLGWTAYGRCDRGSTGGWATADRLYAVVPAYEKDGGIESDAFRVVFLGHETQHFADQNRFPGLANWELEYRAKLVELIQGDAVGDKRLLGFIGAQSDDLQSPHTYANKRVVDNLRARLGAAPETVRRAERQAAALALLREDSGRREAGGTSAD